MSNHASQTSIVPVTAANAVSQGDRRTAVNAVAAITAARATSKPTQARSYRSLTCRDGRLNVSHSVHGTSPIATSPSMGAAQRGT
jgi:hypothetical protein